MPSSIWRDIANTWARFSTARSSPITGETGGMIRAVLRLDGLMCVAVVLTGLIWQFFPETRVARVIPSAFVFWGLSTAFAAFVSGAAVGLLFGLPTTLRRTESGALGSAGDSSSVGYLDSTSLEQVADFLVKGLVALTLTSFNIWSARLETLARNVTDTLLGTTAASPAAGGVILVGFALSGFLTAYLWMRRWFIGELVLAQNEQAVLLRDRIRAEQAKLAQARDDDRQGAGVSSGNNAALSADGAKQMAQAGLLSLSDGHAQEQARAISEAVQAPRTADDPWKGVFGGLAARNGYQLSANVTQLVSDPNNFQVDLLVSVNPSNRAGLVGKMAHFFLHPTFGSRPRDVTIDPDGRAALQVFSYGAFTVGVLIDDGTLLELDLAQLPGVPQSFKDR